MKLSLESLSQGWRRALEPVLDSPEWKGLQAFLRSRMDSGAILHPSPDRWLQALEWTPLEEVRVVIVGQDPYHGPGQAHGLAFSVRPGVKAPPSLKNIFKEIEREYGPGEEAPLPTLERWARQGVLLLNTALSVEEGQAGSHLGKGWEALTLAALRAVAARPGRVFLLWGGPARKLLPEIGRGHQVLQAAHPSPLSAHRGFFGCGHFKMANRWLREHGEPEIDWQAAQPPAVEVRR